MRTSKTLADNSIFWQKVDWEAQPNLASMPDTGEHKPKLPHERCSQPKLGIL